MRDLISRQAAIDAVDKLDYTPGEWAIKGLTMCKDAIKAVPSAQPEQKIGKWIEGKCSECGEHAPFWSMASTYYESKFCPNCGAKMGVVE